MDEVLSLYKPQGMTPLQLVEKFKKENLQYSSEKIGYAGRLDPLAHGVMLLTVGEANKKREPLLSLSKSYRFSVLLGIESDTYDYLGILKNFEILKVPEDYKARVLDFIKRHTGKYSQPYPPFSSKPLNGTPLFKLAKKKGFKIYGENWPSKEVEVFSFELLKDETVSISEISEVVLKNLKQIRGFFRQKRIIEQWKEFFRVYPNYEFRLLSFEIDCSSGTYVRSLAHKLGKELGTGAIAFEINRTRVGDYTAGAGG